MTHREKHRRHQLIVTSAVLGAYAADTLAHTLAPELRPVAVLAAILASLVWIWIE